MKRSTICGIATIAQVPLVGALAQTHWDKFAFSIGITAFITAVWGFISYLDGD